MRVRPSRWVWHTTRILPNASMPNVKKTLFTNSIRVFNRHRHVVPQGLLSM